MREISAVFAVLAFSIGFIAPRGPAAAETLLERGTYLMRGLLPAETATRQRTGAVRSKT